MTVYVLDPLADRRWEVLLAQHPRAGVFHSRAWLRALRDTYDFRPLAFTTSPPAAPLANAIVFCEVRSWLTGRRLVSLPFSDHCDFLTSTAEEEAAILDFAQRNAVQNGARYVELRPTLTFLESASAPWHPAARFCLHRLSLDLSEEALFGRLHKTCLQNKIRRAGREHLTLEQGRSLIHLRVFYRLLVQLRRRHGVPPQPFAWFRNLASAMGDSLEISIANYNARPVAAILTMDCNRTVTYKYGASDPVWNQLGGMPFLFWNAIQQAHRKGQQLLDLGRSDLDNPGLLQFKDRLGAVRHRLTYWRPTGSSAIAPSPKRAKAIVSHLPDFALRACGTLLYRHFG